MRSQNLLRKIFEPANSIAAVFILLGFTGISHHEMWLDELHHWLLARDSATIMDLFYNARHDVHPLLWDALLFILTRFTHDPWWMQVLNLLISSVAAFLVLKYSPFSWVINVLIISGYFFFYEYTVISRNYSAGMMILICCCILFRKRTDHYLLLSLSLGVLANTHLFALFVSLAFVIALIADYFLYPTPEKHEKRKAIYGLALYTGCLALALIQILPPPDSFLTVPEGSFSWQHVEDTLSIMTRAFLPIPQPELQNWWNTNFFIAHLNVPFNLLPVFIIVTPAFILFRKPVALIIFYFSTLSTLVFIFVFQVSAVRYYGFIYFSLLASLWIGEFYELKPIGNRKSDSRSIQRIMRDGFIYGVLIIQVIAGTLAWILDFRKPFSQAHATVDYLVENHFSNEPVITGNCDTGVPVSAYLGKKVFYAQINEWGSFCKWKMPQEPITADTLISRIIRFRPEQDHSLIIILNDSLFGTHHAVKNYFTDQDSPVNIRFLNKFTGSTVRSENYFIYQALIKE